ncbi:MAG: HEAT repeat domain-containing protein [Chloroflexota bacterium]
MKKIQKDKVVKEQSSNSLVETVYLNFLHSQTQKMHIASRLFSLDQIVIEPKLLAPPVIFEPNGPHIHLDIVEETISYLPEFPELGQSFGAPVLGLSEAISKGMNIIITGDPGVGKTTALAYLASSLSTSILESDENSYRVPFLIHAADLILPDVSIKPKLILQPLISAIQEKMEPLLASRIVQYVEYTFLHGNKLLLIDGIDEIPYSEIPNYTNYIKLLLKVYPNTQIIIAAGNDYLDGLLSSNFCRMVLVPWTKNEQIKYIHNWKNLWEKYVSNQAWAAPFSIDFDQYLLENWLLQDNFGLTKMEFAMKTWNAFTGSGLSNSLSDITFAHLRNFIPSGVSEEPIISVALNAVINKQFIFTESQLINWLGSFNSPNKKVISDSPITIYFEKLVKFLGLELYFGSAGLPKQNSSIEIVSKLINTGLISYHKNDKFRFSNPAYLAFFGSKGLSNRPRELINSTVNTQWNGQFIISKYLSTVTDLSENLQLFIANKDSILKKKLLFAGRLLRYSDNKISSELRRQVLTNLVSVITEENHPVPLKTEALIIIIESGSPEIIEIIRQFLHSNSNELRFYSALGIGILREQKFTNEIIEVIDTSSDDVRRAACLALAEIGTNQALEALATFLLHRDEKLRNYSAEALANNAEEGHEALQEGINNADILVRRAVIFGLERINDNWSTEILEKVQLNDDQWAVRNLAIEILKSRSSPNPRIPSPALPVHETPWVIEFAKKHGYVLSPILPNTELLLLALKDANKELFISALQLLKEAVNPDVLSRVLDLKQLDNDHLGESVYHFFKYSALKGIYLKDQ